MNTNHPALWAPLLKKGGEYSSAEINIQMTNDTLNVLAGMDEVVNLRIPADLLPAQEGELATVQVRPLDIHTFQLIAKAGKNDPALIPLLLVKEAVVSPSLDLNQIRKMKVGLVKFLVEEIKTLSGL
ncbi:MAG: hypothetical protein AAFQ98_16560 [Bacteroidota bacterium]